MIGTLKKYFIETRPPFLILSIVLSFLGTSIAVYDGHFRAIYAILAFFGLLFAHISVNVLNDYFDYKSGIDLNTRRTPFSGGSGVLVDGILKPRQVLILGIISFIFSMVIGAYFVIVSGLLLLPIILIAVICIFLYTPVILKTKWPEWAAGLGLGALPIMGTYFAQTASYTSRVLLASIPSGILVLNLLLLNEFPDVEADKKGGRQTLPIVIGAVKAGVVYSILTGLVYIIIIIGVLIKMMPLFALLALFTIPFAVKAIRGALNSQNLAILIPAMASNVMVVLLTQLLLGIGFIIG